MKACWLFFVTCFFVETVFAGDPPTGARQSHWAFQPIRRPEVPAVRNAEWTVNPVDVFIASMHEAKGLVPVPPANRHTLIRRVTLDLTGLPPRPEEVEAFVADESPDAYERLVHRLLSSPAHGERWGRYWLDLARWSDSEGYESDHLRPYAWRYRDYVIASTTSDKPYDRFILEQLAGDELLPFSDENLIATGFLASARLSSNEEDKPRQRNDVLVDIVNATSSTLLGLTLNCAQCHDHKLDPIGTRDYYRFMAFFSRGQPANVTLTDAQLWSAYEQAKAPEYEPALKLQLTILEGARARLIAEARRTLSPETLAALDVPADRRTPAQEQLAREAELKLQFSTGKLEKGILDEDRPLYDALKKKLESLEKVMPDKPQTFAFYSPVTSPTKLDVLPMKGFYPLPFVPAELAKAKTHVLHGGDAHNRGESVEPGRPEFLGPTPDVSERPRTALARMLTAKNPLTARVWVNRIWQHHFGRGLVSTSSDFGTKGAEPTHPQLLDWLAAELIASGWSSRHIHRLIVLSNTYRLSGQSQRDNARINPNNNLLWRWSPRRLESEAIRDSLLAVSGELNLQIGGSPVTVDNASRRSIYLLHKRNVRSPMQALFDGPLATESCPQRYVTTVPLQPLYLLNNDFVVQRASAFARRVEMAAGEDRLAQIRCAFRLAVGRDADATETLTAQKFFEDLGDNPSAMKLFCQALFNLNAFCYLE